MAKSRKKAPSASDYCFVFELNNQSFWFIEKKFWDKHQSAKDTAFDGYLDPILPDGFSEVAESCFEFSGNLHEGRKQLLDAGFTEAFWPAGSR